MTPYDFVDVSGPGNRENAGGLAVDVLYAPVSHFTAIQGVTNPYAAVGDQVSISTDHTFDVGKGFVKLRFVPDTHGLTGTPPEGRDASGYNARVEGDVVAATEEEIAEVLLNLMTSDVIVLIKTANEKWLQLGTEDFPAQIRQMDDTTGTPVEGQSKQRVAIVSNQPKKLYYTGTRTLKP